MAALQIFVISLALTFSGNGLFWVNPTAIKAITAETEEKPRMIRIFLEQNLFTLESGNKKQNMSKESINHDFPCLFVWFYDGYLETPETLTKNLSVATRYLQIIGNSSRIKSFVCTMKTKPSRW